MSYQNLVLNLGVWPPVVTSSSLSPSRRLRKQYTHSSPIANPLSEWPKAPPFRARTAHPGTRPRGRRRTSLLCAAAHARQTAGGKPGRPPRRPRLNAKGPATNWLPALSSSWNQQC
jgi:hypothetical protein